MSIPFDYNKFSDYLREQLETTDNGEVNGFEVLYDYYLDNPPDYLENDDSDFFREEIDGLTQDNIDEVQSVIHEKEASWLEVKGEKWKLKSHSEPTSIPEKSVLYGRLTPEEEALLNRTSIDVNVEERKRLINLYNSKVTSLGTEEEKYKTARLIVDNLVFTDGDHEEYEMFLSTAGEYGNKNKVKGSFIYFEYLAKYYRKNYEHDKSADWFNKASLVAINCNEEKNKILEITRNERLQFEQSGAEEKASAAYIRENNLIAQIDGRKRTRFIYFILRHVSDYFQNPKKVAIWALWIIILSSFIFAISGITPSGGSEQSWRTGEFFTLASLWEFGDALYFSLVTFTTLGYGDYAPSNLVSRGVANIVSMGGLIIASLFLVTLVKRYGR